MPLEGVLFSLTHVAAAVAATAHVLMNKRDVRAAIGWIGVVWLSPIFGALLYVGFGVNRVHRKARRLRGMKQSHAFGKGGGADEDSPRARLALAIEAISGLPLRAATVDQVLRAGDEGYPEMLAAIDRAKTSVELSTFIFRVDEVGERFIAALTRAHKRGVAVRVLIDGMGGGFFLSRAYRRLRAEGVPAARFLHSVLPWRMPLLDLRLHKKALIVDDAVAFVGGLNIAAENVLEKPTAEPVQDVHFRVSGGVVRQIAASFDDDWTFATGEEAPERDFAAHRPAARPERSARMRAIPSGPDLAIDQLALVLQAAIASARSSIRIATPYFLPEEPLLTALQLAALRGVEVTLTTPERNNHRMVAWAFEAHVRPLIEAGCRLYRSPPPFDHSKLMTVDDEWCLIGSANWDARSLRLNFELAVEVYDAELAGTLSKMIQEKCGARITIEEIDGRPLPAKLRDATVRLMAPYL
ncbi:cardiolipin synthase [Methylopila turkensis]|uniref:Phospholipase D n=1 Tax=Methylopila turkensis TaxID=1437816 RepID=A0A9W6JSI9_9HYPH|nr:cardiolipin synthase [Methylopila turkensis]